MSVRKVLLRARNLQFQFLQKAEDLCMQYAAVGHSPDFDKKYTVLIVGKDRGLLAIVRGVSRFAVRSQSGTDTSPSPADFSPRARLLQ